MTLFDNTKKEMTIPSHCPWHEAQQTYGAPNVNWCEPSHCSFIDEPANTWSNLSLLLVGILILWSFKDSKLRFFGFVVLFMGFASAIYHATNNFLSQSFDFIGMVMMTSFILAFEAQRLCSRRLQNFYTLFWFFLSLNSFILIFLIVADIALQNIILLNIAPILFVEVFCGFRDRTIKGNKLKDGRPKDGRLKRYYWGLAALITIAVAQTCAQIDLKRIYCDESNLILHGHVLWHLFSALGMWFMAKHMEIHNKFKPE